MTCGESSTADMERNKVQGKVNVKNMWRVRCIVYIVVHILLESLSVMSARELSSPETPR
jgi:hypothetical protein